MEERDEASLNDYPHGRGYGHDYMRGGEVLGGYGYSEREEYARPRGELLGSAERRTTEAGPDGAADSQTG